MGRWHPPDRQGAPRRSLREDAPEAAQDRRILRLEGPAVVGGALLHVHPEGGSHVPQGAAELSHDQSRAAGPRPARRAEQAMIRRLPLLLPAVFLSCGYEIGNLYEIRDVRVDIFENS